MVADQRVEFGPPTTLPDRPLWMVASHHVGSQGKTQSREDFGQMVLLPKIFTPTRTQDKQVCGLDERSPVELRSQLDSERNSDGLAFARKGKKAAMGPFSLYQKCRSNVRTRQRRVDADTRNNAQ